MKWFNDHDARPWWIALAVLLVALVCVGQVNATLWQFETADDLSYIDPMGGGEGRTLSSTYDNYYYYAGENGGPTSVFMRSSVAYPFTYAAWTIIGSSCGDGTMPGAMRIYNSGGSSLGSASTGGSTAYDRIEVIRTGTDYSVYKNGVYKSKVTTGTTAQFVGPYMSTYYYNHQSFYIDDFIVGNSATAPKNIVTTCPDTWWVAKDMMQPESFSGLYTAYDTRRSATTMGVSYATDATAKTITVTHKESGEVVDSRTTSATQYAGYIQYNLTEMLFDSGAPYGIYEVSISGATESEATDTFKYMGIVTSGTSVEWDNLTYSEDQTATMTFSIGEAYWDTDDYTYRLEIWDESLNEVTGWAITSRPVAATKTETIDSPDYSEGTYYAVLTASDTSSGEEVLMCYDTCTVDMPGTGEVFVTGVTYDATTNTSLASCTVTATQLGADHSTTSDAGTGAYEFTSGLVTDWSLGLNASKTAYTGYLIAFTPYEEGTYGVDLPLVPSGGPEPGDASNTTTSYYNSTVDGTAIGGICWEGPYWTLCEGCNVTVSNSTWSCTTQTGAGGWYQCNNIGCGGTYTLTCSKEGYTNYTKSCTLEEDCFNREDCTLESSTDLNVNCKELSTGALITGTTITVSLSTGEECTTTNGTAVFSGLAYGYYEIEAAAEGYYPGSASAVMDEGKTVTCYLQSQSERTGGSGISYAPHPVRFSFRDQSSNPLDGMTITATPLECTGPWTWLTEWLGLNQTAVDIQGTTLSGTTGDDGSWTAWMIETVRYRMNVVDASRGINTTWTLYPKESEYAYLIDLEPTVPEFEGNIEWNVSAIEVNTTHLYLHCAYSDLLDHTDSCSISVMNSTGGVVYTQACSPANNCSVNYTVENIKGNAYTWGFTAEHTDFGTIANYKGITLEGTGGRLVDLGLDDFWYDMICLGALFMVALFFSSKMNPHGAITLALTGGILWFIGWLNISYLFVACAIVIAILIYAEKKEERSPV